MKNKIWYSGIIILIIMLLGGICANASEIKSGSCGAGVSWSLDSTGVLTISGSGSMNHYISNGYSYNTPWEDYSKTIKEIVLCDGVTSIGQSAFDTCTNLKKVTMSDSITYIGDFAFSGCTNLSSVEMSNNVGSIGKWAFNNCSIKSITIPEKTYSISDYAFNGCEFLEEIIWNAKGVSSFSSDNSIFQSAGESSSGIHFVIGDTAKSLPQYLFYSTRNSLYGEPNVKIVSGGNNLTYVGAYAFYSLDSIESIQIGNDTGISNLELSIGAYAFYRTPNFPKPYCSITINTPLAQVGKYAFYGCEGIQKITIGNNDLSDSTNISIGDYAFASCGSLYDVTINDDVSDIGIQAFISCPLNSLHLGNNITTIGDSAFYWGKFKELIIPDTVTTLGDNAFTHCENLEYLYIGKGIVSLPTNANNGFYQLDTCGKLSTIEVSNDNPQFLSIDGILYDKAGTSLLYCPPAKKGHVVIPNTVTSIGRKAFVYNNSLVSVTSSLTSITIPDSIVNIDTIALPKRESGVVIYGNRESYIETYAQGTNILFVKMDDVINSGNIGNNLTWVLYKDGVLVIKGEGAMPNYSSSLEVPWEQNKNAIKSIIIEKGCSNIGDFAFSECPYLEKIYINDSIADIGYNAFLYDSKLREIFVASANTHYSCEESILYNKDMTALVLYPSGLNNKTYKIKSTVLSIETNAFNKCDNLDTLIILRNVQTINDNAINIAINGKVLGYEGTTAQTYTTNNQITFYSISYTGTCGENLEYLECTDGTLCILGQGAMQNYNNLSGKYASKSPWYSSTTIKNIIIGEGVTRIGNYSFYNCVNLESIYFSSTVNVIGTSAFEGCSNIGKIYMSDISSLFNIDFSGSNPIAIAGGNVYVDNQLVTEITIPSNITTIKKDAFRNHDTLKKIVLHDKITAIGNSAFYDCDGVTEIILPNSVTAIGDYAFYSCGKLTEIIIPDSVTTLGNYVFKYSAIKDIVIGDGVTAIGEEAFYDSRLESITLGKSIKTIGKNAFTYCYITKVNLTSVEAWLNISFGNYASNPLGDTMYSSADLYINNELAKHITIPDGVTTIGDDAFYYCDEIRSITIPSSVTYIGESAFYDCEKLLDVYFGGTREQWNSIEKTNSYIEVACIHCTDEAELPYSQESDFVFSNGVISGYTGSDKIINVPATIGGTPVKMIADKAFYSVSATQIYLPEGIVQIGKSAFQNSSVRRVNIPSTVKSIGSYAFYITDIVEIEIPAGIKTIPTYTFAYCSNLEKITIPNSIETMESDAFCSTHVEELHISDLGAWCNISFADSDSTPMYSNTLLYVNDEVAVDITIPDNATQISKYAFYKYDELKSVVVPSSVKSIGDYAFYECSSLENIIIPDGVTKIGYQSFYECSSLERVSIPDSVTNIGYQSFYNCSTLDYVKIGSGVKSIDNSAFAGCSKLTEVDMGDNVTYIGSGVFKDCVSLQSIIIPQVTTIPSNSFYNCYALKQIEIPKTVTSVGNSAFYACYGITDVYYKGDKDAWSAINLGTENEPLTYGTVHFGELAETKLSLDYAIGMNYKAVRFSVKNVPIGASVILACYNDLGALSYMESIECTEETVSSEFNITNIPNISSAKIMVWGNWSNLKPLCKAEPVDIGWFDLNEF